MLTFWPVDDGNTKATGQVLTTLPIGTGQVLTTLPLGKSFSS